MPQGGELGDALATRPMLRHYILNGLRLQKLGRRPLLVAQMATMEATVAEAASGGCHGAVTQGIRTSLQRPG